MFLKSLVFVLLSSSLSLADVRSGDKTCSCGFYDDQTKELFTDSIIVYFNETTSLPDDFVAEDYEKKYEKDWNAIYRQGANPSNLHLNKSDSLQLIVSPATDIHLVDGAGIRTARHDIQHGSFRTFIKSPGNTSRGSAMSMMWQYNETETTELSVMNTDDPSEAWVGTFVNGEFTTRSLGVNFSTLLDDPVANRNYTTLGGTLGNGSVNPWDYVEYRIDWTEDFINFYIGGNLTRSVLHKDNKGMPSVPSPFFFKHWSTGNRFTMEGPPKKPSEANIGWIRMFFNSSTMNEEAREDFVVRCPLTEACSMDDIALRGSTPHADSSTVKWKQDGGKNIKRMPALWISVICISFSTLLLLHAFIRRAPWRTQPKTAGHEHAPAPAAPSTNQNPFENSDYNLPAQNQNPFENREYTLASRNNSLPSSPIFATRPPSSNDGYESKDELAIEKADTSPHTSVWGGSTNGGPSRPNSLRFDSRGTTPGVLSPTASHFDIPREEFHPALRSQLRVNKDGKTMSRNNSERTIAVAAVPGPGDKIPMETVTESALPAPRMRPQPPPPRQRVDYLAGLVAMCAILVTVMHFGLSFVPAMVIPGAPRHYQSEYWVQQLIAPFILNQMWLGVFFTTSVRFLVASYLKKGNMQDIAKAAVRRTPRLMIPVASIALLQYFVIDCGATMYLRYIPSITWSTWPYVTRYPTFGHYVSEVLELVYLIPNAVPQITYNYCTGVLWTIAVQLQGSWLVLLGCIVVYEIKTPWKRMSYYVFCLFNHWYAQSWGSYLWLGLLLTDLDITYTYKKWLYDRPGVYYPLISFCWICVAAGFSANLIPNWVNFNFATYEHNIHPDPNTGEPMWNTDSAGYPPYYVPRLNGLLFAGGMQAIVELSPAVQWFLSLPFLLVLFPHIFTIYLMHGLVFWSYGSWLMVFLAERGFGYGVNVAVVGVTSYFLLFAILPIVTPIIEALGKDITALVWMSAVEKSPPRRRTLFPFPDDLFVRREKNDVEAMGSVDGSGRTSPSEKGKMKEKEEVREISQFDY
ncbi:glycoside hydrolase family 16 protein [Trematosphaeria pertusa]|uniref:Glycoside hydrolase family 16 protein n=1 Tax=Trematosphaeria pertusa TaxID=390896 RepID=A0A6A6IZ55_9PLEO|nr:glycoside hydrolase family 16 protein [Trematosphaeria pertusa]KAF2255337.1 glycoside hydrolase family 16 protein [Trematosphaeria pertusa]